MNERLIPVQCMGAFSTFELSANKAHKLQVKGCCTNIFKTAEDDALDINFVQIDEIREYSKSFRLDELLPCKYCGKREEGYIKDTENYIHQNKKIMYLIGEHCNARCKICSDYHDPNTCEVDIEESITVIKERVTKQDIDELELLTIIGGETLLYHDKISLLISRLAEEKLLGNASIKFYTNGSIDPTKFLDMLLSKGLTNNKIIFVLSIDGDFETNHVMRPPCELQTIVKTAAVLEAYGIEYSINHALSIFNIEHVKNNIELYYSIFKNLTHVSLGVVFYPRALSINNIDNKKKLKIYKSLRYLDVKYTSTGKITINIDLIHRELFKGLAIK